MAERITLALWEPVQALPGGCGVYAIRCAANGRFYIGSSLNVVQRVSRHFTMLRGGRHENSKLQRHYEKYGEVAFAVELLERADPTNVYEVEQRWIDRFWPSGLLLNVQRLAGRPPTFHELNEETREKKRAKHKAQLGRPASLKQIEGLKRRKGKNNPNYGKRLSPERKLALRARMSGENNPGFGRKGELSPLYGLRRDAETRARMSAAQRLRVEQGAVNAKAMPCMRTEPCGRVTHFPSARAASVALGLGSSTVARWCRGDRRPEDGSRWEFRQ